jgi:hypothetical protein
MRDTSLNHQNISKVCVYIYILLDFVRMDFAKIPRVLGPASVVIPPIRPLYSCSHSRPTFTQDLTFLNSALPCFDPASAKNARSSCKQTLALGQLLC